MIVIIIRRITSSEVPGVARGIKKDLGSYREHTMNVLFYYNDLCTYSIKIQAFNL